MNFESLIRAVVSVAVVWVFLVPQSMGQEQAPQAAGVTITGTKIAVIDIDRVAAESNAGKALFEKLKQENDRIAADRAKKQQELRELEAKLSSEVLSADAKEELNREVERKRTEAQRWLEDAQRDFKDKQQKEEQEFQKTLAPVVEKVAKENGIGLIFRATPGLTFILDPNLDITPLVIKALNEASPPSQGAGKPQD